VSQSIESQLHRLQRSLERFYALERAPSVRDFFRLGAANTREQLLVRESTEGLHVAIQFPEDRIPEEPMRPSDDWAQLIEAVSHFLFLAERARTELPTTQLELELQAEVDKFVVLLPTAGAPEPCVAAAGPASVRLARTVTYFELHRSLYDDVSFLHAAESPEGVRYRLANQLAAQYVSRLLRSGSPELWRKRLRAFYRAGQTEKISLVLAA